MYDTVGVLCGTTLFDIAVKSEVVIFKYIFTYTET